MEKIPLLPSKPEELTELETRRGKIREQRQAVQDELQRLQDEAWSESQRDVGLLDLAAEKLANGEIETVSREAMPEEIEILRSRLDLLQRAEQKVAQRVAEGCAAHNRQVAGAHKPGHREAAQRIARALRELVEANKAEQTLRDRAPNGFLPPMDFPGIGVLGAAGGAARFWMEHAKRHGYLVDEDDAQLLPAAAY